MAFASTGQVPKSPSRFPSRSSSTASNTPKDDALEDHTMLLEVLRDLPSTKNATSNNTSLDPPHPEDEPVIETWAAVDKPLPSYTWRLKQYKLHHTMATADDGRKYLQSGLHSGEELLR